MTEDRVIYWILTSLVYFYGIWKLSDYFMQREIRKRNRGKRRRK